MPAAVAQESAEEETTAMATAANATERTITVNGSGQVNMTPDIAIVRLGVQTEADSAAQALDDNSVRMQAVISATQAAGIAAEDIRTTGLRLQPRYDRPDDGGVSQVTGYQASNNVEVTVRDLALLGPLLDEAVAAGSNTIDNIRFEVTDRAALAAAAREAAMNDAIAKAEQLTDLAGTTLGPVVTIRETGGTTPIVVQEAAAFESAAVPVQPGTQTIEASVQVVWHITPTP